MENSALLLSHQPESGKTARKVLRILSAYPLFWTAGILIAGLFKSQMILTLVMVTWVVAFYIGALSWIGLSSYLLGKKAISFKAILFNLLIAVIGIAAAYFVYEFDILGSGVKYID